MNKKKYPLVIFAIVSLVVIAVSAIIVGIFGINSSIEIGGGSQIEITISADQKQNAAEYASKASDVLKQHSASVDTYFVEDKLVDSTLVIRIANRNIKNADSIKAELATALGFDQSKISNVQLLNSYFSNRLVLYIGLAVLAVLAICFFMGWLRYGLLAGVSLLFGVLHSLILSLAIIFVSRIQFSMVGLCVTVILSLLSAFAFACILERHRENSKSSQYDDLSYDQKLMLATKQNKWLLIVAGVALLTSLVMILTPVGYVRFAGLNVLMALVSSAYTVACITPALHSYLLELAGAKQKKKLSKNNTQKNK